MTSHMPMGIARQPFAPLNSSRLQNITSVKNRQNALSPNPTSPSKRKATTYESDDDSENVDPLTFGSPKRSKAVDAAKDSFSEPTHFFLINAPPSPTDAALSSPLKPTKPINQRNILQPRSQTPKVTTSVTKSTPLTAPAGRSPTRKRVGILNNRRRTFTPITSVDPPKFSTPKPSGLSFSIDAALSGTIPSYGARQPQRQALSSKSISTSSSKSYASRREIPASLHASESKSSWFFQIHEDTEEELATNLMEHSTCTLDISSDEESLTRMRDERGKENVPPLDDISQTRTSMNTFASSSSTSSSMSRRDEMEIREMKLKVKMQRKRREMEEGVIDVDRSPLGEMRKEDFYGEGCDEKSVFVILPDPEPQVLVEDEAEEVIEGPSEQEEQISEPTTITSDKGKGKGIDIDFLVQKKIVEPIEQPEADFVVWESGSAKDENE
ncbi:74bd1066-ed0e-47e5-a103-870eb762b47a [Sclerotinia trifoliorum]|uniref:74bd1066-ed0e-47e5-a103-870eb762b47a n=1 Tax=Sclerotinia trifoliorum TaxID=28548 RepID=A0A8H2VR39_9HELO|nr:74bd1066-ed0e-47e5-a103-870eb762b47a [Sclerotinia trifoliorum]